MCRRVLSDRLLTCMTLVLRRTTSFRYRQSARVLGHSGEQILTDWNTRQEYEHRRDDDDIYGCGDKKQRRQIFANSSQIVSAQQQRSYGESCSCQLMFKVSDERGGKLKLKSKERASVVQQPKLVGPRNLQRSYFRTESDEDQLVRNLRRAICEK